MAPEVI